MRATATKSEEFDKEQKLAVDVESLAKMLSCGQYTARKIGEQAKARVKIGKRILYSVSKIEKYLDECSE